MSAIVGEGGLTDPDRRALGFADRLERELVHQPGRRTIEETLAVGWTLLESLPRSDLIRISEKTWSERPAPADAGAGGGMP
jgi:V/A-type H+-transporting ATPase subunit B